MIATEPPPSYGTQVLCLQFRQQSVTIYHHSQLIYDTLSTHLRHCLRASHLPCADAVASLKENPVFSTESNLIDLMNEAISHLITPCDDALLFHAAGVARGDRGILLCGASGTGKSTLSAWLLQCRYAYLSDELIAVSRRNAETIAVPHQMHGLARSLVMKTGSAFVWNTLPDNAASVYRFADGSAWVSPKWFGATIEHQCLPHMVLFPRYQSNAPFQVKPLSFAETTFALLQNLVNARNLPHYGLTKVSSLAQSVTAYEVTYSNLAHVSDWMERAL